MNQDNSSSPLAVLPLKDIRMRSGKYLRDSMASFSGVNILMVVSLL